MAVVTRTLHLSAIVAVAGTLIFSSNQAAAQPLVSGGLVIYYDYDNFTNTVMDGSGNGFNGKVQDGTRNVLDQPFTLNTTGVISNDHSTFKRGGGAINFTHSTVAGEDPVFVDMDGQAVSDSSVSIPADTNAVTIAAWVNARSYATDFSVQQGASGGHGVPHFQIQSNGQIRFTLRDNAGQNLVDTGNAATPGTSVGHPWPNQLAVNGGATGTPWPLNEWHHVAITYDYNGDWDGAASASTGHLDVFYDGVKIKTQGNTGPGTLAGPWQLRGFADFYDGLGLGAVYDSGSRRTEGWLDETYIFNRKLTDAEVLTLYNIAPPGVPGDYNGNGKVDGADYVLWRNGGPLLNEVDVPGTVNAADYTEWRSRFGNPPGSGSVAAVPEPASLGVLLVCLGILAGTHRRER
jgi:hypothetical protein